MLLQSKRFPKLYKTSSRGSEQEWEIVVNETEDGIGEYTTYFGQVDGQIQTTTVKVLTGKNIGRANETSPYEQACREAESKWKKQLDKGYSEQRGGASMARKPMLAQSY